jgi:glycosyltransferase involved in cell wall biosynthesis
VFFLDGGVCEECLGRRFPWPGVMHACYRDNLAASGTVAAMLAVHRALHTWSKLVDVYITLTEFARNKLVEGGLAREKIVVKPNFVFPDPGAGQGRGGYALFAGRLSPEKGLDTMLTAWESLSVKPPLKIAGEGPLAPRVAELAQRSGNVEYLGRVPKEQVLNLMQGAAVLIFPSNCYEGFPMTIAEAFATGLPVIASGMGSMSSLIEHGRTGLHFRPGDTEDLASKVEWAFSHPGELADMRCQARARFETEYTADRNYALLMDIYGRSVRTK